MSSSKAREKHCRDFHEDSKPPAKRSRGGDEDVHNNNQMAPSNYPELNEDALSLVMEFLPPRDLFNTAFTCKHLRDKVTTATVVRSAMIHGGHAKTTCEELRKLMTAKSMYVPSPLRLLRLTVGRRCEFCNRNKANHVRPSMGVFACWDCTTDHTESGLTKAWDRTWVRYRRDPDGYAAVFDHPFVASATRSCGVKAYLWRQHRFDSAGERIGPIITFDDIDELIDYVGYPGGIELYFRHHLSVVLPDAQDYDEFNTTYTEIKERAERVVAERWEKRCAASQRREDNRKAKIDKMISDLACMLEEPFRDVALKRTDIAYRHSAPLSKLPCLRFSIPFVDTLMKPYIITPSKIRKKVLKIIADDVNRKLRLIEAFFLSPDFLSEKDPFEASLKRHFSETVKSLEALLEMKRLVTASEAVALFNDKFECRSSVTGSEAVAVVDDTFLDFLESNRFMAALAHLKGNDFSWLLLPAENVVQNEPKLRTLAKNIWFSKLDEDASDDSRFGRAFEASSAVFEEARLAIEEYTCWLQKKHPDNEYRCKFGRNDAFNKILAVLPFLLSRDFEGLNKHQDSAWGVRLFPWQRF